MASNNFQLVINSIPGGTRKKDQPVLFNTSNPTLICSSDYTKRAAGYCCDSVCVHG